MVKINDVIGQNGCIQRQYNYLDCIINKYILLVMGNKLMPSVVKNLQSEQIDLAEQQQFVRSIKTAEDIEAAIKRYLGMMTIKEKLGQLQQVNAFQYPIPQDLVQKISNGEIGSVLNSYSIQINNAVQDIAMTKSRLKIPILIGKDVIHGFRTVFPIPLAQAASFNRDLVEQGSRIAAIQCSSTGIKWTFSPMVDIARDPRWGRIAEGYGEDPYLASELGKAAVRGYQSKNLNDITSVAACGKHYVGYGATQGGRDYNTTIISQSNLRDIYLTPFKQLAENGCLTYMSAFNDLNGEPSTGNAYTLKQILRNEWKFDGLVVSDYGSVTQLIAHGFAADYEDAARISFNAGLDMQMVSTCIADHFDDLLKKNLVKISDLDVKVANILRVKLKLNLFQNYHTDPDRQKIILDPVHKQSAQKTATQCAVLLQNKNSTLPLSNSINNLAVIGALANDPDNQLGTWVPDGKSQDSITPLTSLKAYLTNTKISYASGYKDARSTDTSYFADALSIANSADKILLFVGQDNGLSGESHSRSNINLPGVQEDLVRLISKTGKPIVLVVYAGRPLLLEPLLPLVDSIIYAWHLGTMAGPALVDLIFGKVSPSGKLPVSFLRALGQIPTYYNKKNTGRPNDSHEYVPFTSSYIDIDSTPLFPFGFGLSYSNITYSNLKLSRKSIGFGQSLIVSASVKNEGSMKVDETVFLFIRDLVGSYTRPVKELKDFKRITLAGGEQQTVNFVVSPKMLCFWTTDKEFKAEVGKFNVWIAKNANEGLMDSFDLTSSKQEEPFGFSSSKQEGQFEVL